MAQLEAIPHVGRLIERIRESRGWTRKYLAQRCDADLTVIHRLETGTTRRPKQKARRVERIAEVLQHSDLTKPLSPEQARLLIALNMADDKRTEYQAEFASIDFRQIIAPHRYPGLGECVQWLREQDQPAMIVDPLLFIHAINGAVPRLFGISTSSEHLSRWDMWHVVATKFHRESPARARQPDTDFMAQIAEFFLEHSGAWRYFFTAQMDALLTKLARYANEQDYPFFTEWWNRATSFDLSFNLRTMPRRMEFWDGTSMIDIYVDTDISGRRTVRLSPETGVAFLLLRWKPLDRAAEEAFARIGQYPDSHQVFYAADYDRDNTFHVNTWPEVHARITTGADAMECQTT